MNRLILGLLITAATPMGIMAQDYNVSCKKAGDERVIEVMLPGEVGAACDVRYTRDGGADISVPYHANNAPDYCQTKARDIVSGLADAGYNCAPTNESVASVAASTNVSAPAPQSPAVGEPEEVAPVATAAGDVVVAEAPAIEIAAPAAADADDLNEKMNAILAEAPTEETAVPSTSAVRGPAQLTADVEQPEINTAAPAPVGRLVGATPDSAPTPLAEPPLEVSAVEPVAEAAPAPQAVTSPTPVAAVGHAGQGLDAAPAPTTSQASDNQSLRDPADIIEATLHAQAAAWNEGNLDAYMETYWKSDDLKFVSDVDITNGWSDTLKRYRDRYAGDDGLGWLVFDKIDVEVVTDDVAVVTGRYNLTKGDAVSSGAYSLVMKQMAGVWQIVHDHTTADPVTEE